MINNEDPSRTGAHVCRERIESILDLIDRDEARGDPYFLSVNRARARREADAADRIRTQRSNHEGPLWGLPVSVKDVFDVQGEVTRAGSLVLASAAPAAADCPIFASAQAAGMIYVGRTNMTEFAYSGLGLNPHFGTPGNALDVDRIPGGSSSGAAVAVARGASAIAIATDTSGSTRVPAALNGVVGFKGSRQRYARAGMVPLSSTQDAVGILTASVRLCAEVDAVLSGDSTESRRSDELSDVRVAVPSGFLLEDLDVSIARGFSQILTRLSRLGMRCCDCEIPGMQHAQRIGLGGIVGPEAYALHAPLLAQSGDQYDPRVRRRLVASRSISQSAYLDRLDERRVARALIDQWFADWDVLICPTTPMVAPAFRDIVDDYAYSALNRRILRNTFAFNILDLPAITLPAQFEDPLPIGLMVIGKRLQDRALLRIAEAIERALVN